MNNASNPCIERTATGKPASAAHVRRCADVPGLVTEAAFCKRGLMDHSAQDIYLYELVGRDPHTWLFNAAQLKRAADTVKVEIGKAFAASNHPDGRVPIQDLYLFYSYFLLAGLSLENLAKGILIGRSPNIVSNGKLNLKMLAGSSNGHHLANLAAQAGIQLSAEERNILPRLKEFIVWGKYPIHLSVSGTVHQSFSCSDFSVIDELFEKFSAVLKSETPNPSVHYAS
jgi:hypothetical protein